MIDRESLREALEWWDSDFNVQDDGHGVERIVEAARLVADLAEKVWWCEQHLAAARAEGHSCDLWSVSAPCLMTERFLLPVGVWSGLHD